jgi:hypothetical protein
MSRRMGLVLAACVVVVVAVALYQALRVDRNTKNATTAKSSATQVKDKVIGPNSELARTVRRQGRGLTKLDKAISDIRRGGFKLPSVSKDKGPPGIPGVPGRAGTTGATGAASAVPGPSGKASTVAGPQGEPGIGCPPSNVLCRGPEGEPGRDGSDGKDGADGAPGQDGKTPVSIQTVRPDGQGGIEVCQATDPDGDGAFTCP